MNINKTAIRVIEGTEDLSTWTDEELERGMKRDKRGQFRRPPVLVARAVHDELVRRKMSKAYNLLRESTYDAVRTLREVVNDEEADNQVRIRAAELILDRTLGKAPQHVSLGIGIEDQSPFQRMIAAAIIGSAEQADDVVDAEIIEEEE